MLHVFFFFLCQLKYRKVTFYLNNINNNNHNQINGKHPHSIMN